MANVINASQLPISVNDGIAVYRFEIEDGLTVEVDIKARKIVSASWDVWDNDSQEWTGEPAIISEIVKWLPSRLFA